MGSPPLLVMAGTAKEAPDTADHSQLQGAYEH